MKTSHNKVELGNPICAILHDRGYGSIRGRDVEAGTELAALASDFRNSYRDRPKDPCAGDGTRQWRYNANCDWGLGSGVGDSEVVLSEATRKAYLASQRQKGVFPSLLSKILKWERAKAYRSEANGRRCVVTPDKKSRPEGVVEGILANEPGAHERLDTGLESLALAPLEQDPAGLEGLRSPRLDSVLRPVRWATLPAK